MIKINILLIVISLLIVSCGNVSYEEIADMQDDSVPELSLFVTSDTRALVVLPHADDEVVFGGLIAKLKSQGATIHLLTLTQETNLKKNEVRLSELACSALSLGIDSVEIAGLINNTWDNVMRDSITFWYDQKDSIKHIIQRKINAFKPEILITYDTELGAYGHPEHRISAQLTEEIFNHPGIAEETSPETLLQFTLTEALEQFLSMPGPGYELSKKLTGASGLPQPEVAVTLEHYWKFKNKAAHCYQSQEKTLRKFYLWYDVENELAFKQAISREYYTIDQHPRE